MASSPPSGDLCRGVPEVSVPRSEGLCSNGLGANWQLVTCGGTSTLQTGHYLSTSWSTRRRQRHVSDACRRSLRQSKRSSQSFLYALRWIALPARVAGESDFIGHRAGHPVVMGICTAAVARPRPNAWCNEHHHMDLRLLFLTDVSEPLQFTPHWCRRAPGGGPGEDSTPM